MAEIVIRGVVNVADGEEGMKHILIQDESGDNYRIPCPADCAQMLAAALTADGAELENKAARQAAAAKIVIPGFNGNGVNLN